jgi:hypothetical protein
MNDMTLSNIMNVGLLSVMNTKLQEDHLVQKVNEFENTDGVY